MITNEEIKNTFHILEYMSYEESHPVSICNSLYGLLFRIGEPLYVRSNMNDFCQTSLVTHIYVI